MWSVYEFLDRRGYSTVRAWLEQERVPKEQVAAFRAKMDALKHGGPEMTPGLIEGPIKKKKSGIAGIYKLKIKGNKGWVQLRPLLCEGPFPDDVDTFTILIGAIEKDGVLQPEDCLERADRSRSTLLNDRSRRRIPRIPRRVKV